MVVTLSVRARLRREYSVGRAQVHLRLHGVSVGTRPAYGKVVPFIRNEGVMKLGDRVLVEGEGSATILTTTPGALMVIGDDVFLNTGCSVRARASVIIGPKTRVGPGAAIADTDFHEVQPGSGIRTFAVAIGQDVWVSRGAVVGPGVTIGDGAVIGALSVVRDDVPPHSLAVGSPARVVRTWAPGTRPRR